MNPGKHHLLYPFPDHGLDLFLHQFRGKALTPSPCVRYNAVSAKGIASVLNSYKSPGPSQLAFYSKGRDGCNPGNTADIEFQAVFHLKGQVYKLHLLVISHETYLARNSFQDLLGPHLDITTSGYDS